MYYYLNVGPRGPLNPLSPIRPFMPFWGKKKKWDCLKKMVIQTGFESSYRY